MAGETKYCSEPDVDQPKLECGHPLPCPRHPAQLSLQETVEGRIKDIATVLSRMCGKLSSDFPDEPAIGFCLMLFTFGDGGFASWVSNAERQTMLAGVRELLDKVSPEDLELDDDDEGELRFGITADHEKVVLAFGTTVSWLGMPPQQAADLGVKLIEKARSVAPVSVTLDFTD